MDGLFAIFMVLIPVNVLSYVPSRLCDGDACNVDWTPIPNLGSALVGYNPVLSNTLMASDPGMKAMIFSPTKTRPAPDNRVVVNPNILYYDDIHCQVSQVTKVVSSYQDYAKQRAGSFKFSSHRSSSSNFKIPLFTLILNYERKESEQRYSSEDSDFQKDVKFFKDQGGEIYVNQAKCQVYKVQIDEFAKPVFTDGFIRALQVLAEEAADPELRKDKDSLKRFIDYFGTHYLAKSWLGATLTVESRFDRQSSSQSERNQRKQCIGSAYGKSVNSDVRLNTFQVSAQLGEDDGDNIGISTELGGQGGGSGNGSGESKRNCSSFDALSKGGAGSSFRGSTVTSVGAYPLSDANEWAKTTGNNPRVISFELKPISDLFRSYFLNHIEGLKGKARLMKKYFEDSVFDYCKTMLGEECPTVKECGYQNLCPVGNKCVNAPNSYEGFKCIKTLPKCVMMKNWSSWTPCVYDYGSGYGGNPTCGRGISKRIKTNQRKGMKCDGEKREETQKKDCNTSQCPAPKVYQVKGTRGDWGPLQYCGNGVNKGYVVNFEIRIDAPDVGTINTDLTLLNSVCLTCDDDAYDQKKPMCSNSKNSREYGRSNRASYRAFDCYEGYTGFSLKFLEPCAITDLDNKCDEVAAIDIRFKCGKETKYRSATSADAKTFFNKGWEDLIHWVDYDCPVGEVICGFRTRVQANQGSGDDTGLNGVEMHCCKNIWKHDKKWVVDKWLKEMYP